MQRVEEGLRRIKEICEGSVAGSLSVSAQSDAEHEIRTIIGDIFEALDDAAQFGISNYLQEKLTALTSFALMAVGSGDRGSFSDAKILDNISHFSYILRTRT